MRSILTLLLFLSLNSIAQNQSAELLKQDVLKSQNDRIAAMIGANIDVLETFLADDLTYSHTNGWTETKAGYLETLESGNINYITFVPKDVNVRIYGDTAVLTGKVAVNLGRTDFEIKFLEVQRKVDNKWLLVAWQSVLNKAK